MAKTEYETNPKPKIVKKKSRKKPKTQPVFKFNRRNKTLEIDDHQRKITTTITNDISGEETHMYLDEINRRRSTTEQVPD
uniref:Uncharacterized protein n=1 Tax=Rhizophora mucronata TaxID=61149 RepID=A0A2P2ITC2_RHIMU